MSAPSPVFLRALICTADRYGALRSADHARLLLDAQSQARGKPRAQRTPPAPVVPHGQRGAYTRQVLTYVQEHPGALVGEISRSQGIKEWSVRSALRRLCARGEIIEHVLCHDARSGHPGASYHTPAAVPDPG